MIDYFARHRTAANLLMVVFILLGVLALPDLNRETFPEFEPSNVRISVRYPGAPTEIVDEVVVQRVEDALGAIEGIAHMESQAREGGASIRLELDDDTDYEAFVTEAQSAMDAIRDFPAEVEEPTVSGSGRGRRAAAVASVAVTGPMSAHDLKLYCELLKREMLRHPDIAMVSVGGFSAHQLRIRADRGALDRYGLQLNDISGAVSAHSFDAPIGTIEARDGDILVRYSDKRTTVDELGDIVVKGAATGAEVRLADVAQIEDVFSVEASQTHFNGARAGILTITRTSQQDSLEVLAAVNEFLEDQQTKKPRGVELTLTDDSASVIQDRLDLLINNGWQGFLLVFLALWLFFGPRMSFWVAAGLPVSFLGALFLMELFGQTLNMMTMMGLLVALGLLMDDGIVLADNVAAHLSRGKTPLRAAIDGVREVAGGVVSSFLTTACVFIPLSAIEGRIGRTLQVIPFVLLSVLAVSLAEAFLILPHHLAHSLRAPEERPPGRFRQWFDRGFARVREAALGRAVDWAVRYRYIVGGATVGLIVASLGMITSGTLRYRAFPDTEGDTVQFELEMSPGTPLERTKQEIDRVAAAAWQVSAELASDQPRDLPLVRNVSARFNYNRNVEEPGPHTATVIVDLLSVEVRNTTLKDFTAAWREEAGPMPSAVSANFGAGGRRGPRGGALEVRIEGDDLKRLEEVAGHVKQWFAELDGVSDISDNLQPGSTQIAVRLRPGAGAMGIDGKTLSSQLSTALSGISIEHLYKNDIEYETYAELDRRHRDTVADLEVFPVVMSPGVSVPLGAIATIESERSFARITRVNGVRTASVRASLDPEAANANAIMANFQETKAPELRDRFPDVTFAAGGEAEQSARTLGSMGRGLILGLFAIFVLLSLQFRSYVEPLLVMLAIPFAFVGVIWGSTIIAQPLSSQAILGIVSLAGVVVNDSILLVAFAKQARARGLEPHAAACQASRDRFRAVLLTSVTTIMGLLPLILFETSRQAQVLVPVATSIVFGMIASTLLILIVLPAIYAILADLKLVGTVEPDDPRSPPETGGGEDPVGEPSRPSEVVG